jgi:hypothetical protein
MTEKDIIKITKMLLNSYDTSDVIFDITQEYPKYKNRIEKIVKEHNDSNDFEEKVKEKALELFVRDGNMSVHFPLKHRTEYYGKAREILNKDIL